MDKSDCITTSKSGLKEARIYKMSGKFLIYEYESMDEMKKNSKKSKIVLKDLDGNVHEYFIIPTRDGKFLVFKAENKGERGVLKDENCVSISNFL